LSSSLTRGWRQGKAILEGAQRRRRNDRADPEDLVGPDRSSSLPTEVKAAGGRIDRDAAIELLAAIGNDLRESRPRVPSSSRTSAVLCR